MPERSIPLKKLLTLFLIAGSGIVAGVGVQAVAQSVGGSTDVQSALAARLPKTPLTSVDCDKIDGICEVQAGQNLFYTDVSGRYLIIGRVYDMETRQDLTAARLLDINPDMLVGAAASGGASAGGEAAGEGEGSPIAAASEPNAAKVDPAALASLPASGAISWGRAGPAVTVFSDMRCGYCQRLHDVLGDMNVRVSERPISILGTRAISDAVICSSNRRRALDQAYAGEPVSGTGDCDTSGLTANEQFAKAHGFTGTPVIVRADGAVIQGYRPREFLEAWLKGDAS
jgi:thiol:disulfide interchange protein DsbC